MFLSQSQPSIILRAFGFALVFLVGVVCGNCARSIAVAQDTEPTAVQLAYALDVARTSANEASMSARPNDVRLTYEATRSHGDTDRERLAWLRRHSRCTNPRGDCNRDGTVDERDDVAARRRPGNARWSRNLRWSDARPANLRGRWDVERWRNMRALALALVLADVPTDVCGEPVHTWGRRSDFEARPELVPVECDAANLGGTTPAIRARHERGTRIALAREVR